MMRRSCDFSLAGSRSVTRSRSGGKPGFSTASVGITALPAEGDWRVATSVPGDACSAIVVFPSDNVGVSSNGRSARS